jgi:hypothetical protein
MVVPWYRPEQWTMLCAAAADQAELGDSYDQWETLARRAIQGRGLLGEWPVRVDVDVPEMIRWCRRQGRALDSAARVSFARRKLLQTLRIKRIRRRRRRWFTIALAGIPASFLVWSAYLGVKLGGSVAGLGLVVIILWVILLRLAVGWPLLVSETALSDADAATNAKTSWTITRKWRIIAILPLMVLGTCYSKSCGLAYHGVVKIGRCTDTLAPTGCTYDGSKVVLTYRINSYGEGCSRGATTDETLAHVSLSKPCDFFMPRGERPYGRAWGLQCRPIAPVDEGPEAAGGRCLAVVPSARPGSNRGDYRIVCGCPSATGLSGGRSVWENEDGEETIGYVAIEHPYRRDYRPAWSYVLLGGALPLAVAVDTVTLPVQICIAVYVLSRPWR